MPKCTFPSQTEYCYLPWVFSATARQVSLRIRRVLKEFIFVLSWTVSPTLIHEFAFFSSWLRHIRAKSRKSVDRYHANVSEDATTRPDMPQSSLEGHRSQACFREYVQKYLQHLFKRYIRPMAFARPKIHVWSPSTPLYRKTSVAQILIIGLFQRTIPAKDLPSSHEIRF